MWVQGKQRHVFAISSPGTCHAHFNEEGQHLVSPVLHFAPILKIMQPDAFWCKGAMTQEFFEIVACWPPKLTTIARGAQLCSQRLYFEYRSNKTHMPWPTTSGDMSACPPPFYITTFTIVVELWEPYAWVDDKSMLRVFWLRVPIAEGSGFMNYCLRCVIHDVWCVMSGIWCTMYEVWRMTYDAWYMM
jgi:hypothetical protein